MPAQTATVVILDGKATPLTHTFTSMGAMPNAQNEIVATWINRVASTLTGGAERLIAYFKQKPDGGFNFRVSTVMPITESVSGVNAVTRVLRATTTYEVPANASAIERKDLRVLHANATSNVTAAIYLAVDDGTPVV